MATVLDRCLATEPEKEPGVVELYDSKLRIAELLLQQWVQDYPERKYPVTFDNWYTQPDFCRFLDKTLELPYVGTLATNDEVVLKSGAERLDAFAARLKKEHKEAVEKGGRLVFKPITIRYKGEREQYYSYCATHRLRNYGKHRLVINHRQADLSDKPIFLMSNRLIWQAPGITRIRRHRWPIEVYYEEGKAEGLAEGLVEGKAEGLAEGRAKALLSILSARGLELPKHARERILSCADIVLLDRWIARAAVAASVSEIFVDELISALDAKPEADQPFLAVLSFQAVHWPHHAPKAALEKYARTYDVGWDEIRAARHTRTHLPCAANATQQARRKSLEEA